MRAKDAGHRLAVQEISEHLLPQVVNAVCSHAAIDDAPTVSVAQQPQINMVQTGQFQWHPQPVNARRDFLWFARRGGVFKRILDCVFGDHELPFRKRVAWGPCGCRTRYLVANDMECLGGMLT